MAPGDPVGIRAPRAAILEGSDVAEIVSRADHQAVAKRSVGLEDRQAGEAVAAEKVDAGVGGRERLIGGGKGALPDESGALLPGERGANHVGVVQRNDLAALRERAHAGIVAKEILHRETVEGAEVPVEVPVRLVL